MLRNLTALICIGILFTITGCTQKNFSENWLTLFNGKDLKDWDIKIAGYPLDENLGNTFRVEDGLLKVSYDGYNDSLKGRYGHIFYKKKFSAYLLVAEYRFYGKQVADGPGWAYLNNGLMLFCQSPQSMTLNQDYPISVECQLLGSDSLATRPNANDCTPGTNIMMNGKLITQHCTDSHSKPSPAYQWTHVEVLVLRDSVIKQIVGTDTVLVYENPTIGGGSVHHADPKVKIDGKLLTDGYIALQSESMPTEFRMVKLYNLAPYMDNPQKLDDVLHWLQHRKDKNNSANREQTEL
jgi:hypothetical protein